MRRLTVLVLALAAIAAAPAPAQTFPKFTGLVTDAANVIPDDQEAAIKTRLETLQQTNGRQLVVATVPDLQGYPIEDYGYRLGRAWSVGLKGMDNGAILLVAPNEHKVRIEVGYGLEPVLTDAFSSVIVNDRILPRFKAGDLPGGITAGTNAIADQLSLPDDEAKAKLGAAVAAYDKTHRSRQSSDSDGFPLGLVFWLVVLGFGFLPMLFRGRRRGMMGRHYGGGSNWPIVLWSVANELNRGSRGGGGFGGFGDGGGSGGGGWMGGGFTGGGGGSFGGGGASGSW